MQKFLNVFITICVILIGAISAIKLFYGGGSELSGSYLDHVAAIAKQTGVIMNDITPYFQGTVQATPEELLTKVTKAKGELIKLNHQAKDLSAPDNMQNLHRQFMGSLNDYVGAFELTEEGLQKEDNTKIDRAGDLLMHGATQMKGVSEGILQLAREPR